jgi:hypothetical protein
MSKATLSISFAIFFAYTLAACGGGGSDGSGQPPAPPQPPTQVTISGVATDDPVDGATVELLNSSDVRIASTVSDASGQYSVTVSETDVASGYKVRATGGQVSEQPFTGELLGIYSSSDDRTAANATLLTTIVARLAESQAGASVVERRDSALSLMSTIGAIDTTDWNHPNPTNVDVVALRYEVGDSGFDATIDAIVDEFSDADLSDYSMTFFPYAHGGIHVLSIANNAISDFIGRQGYFRVLFAINDPSANVEFSKTEGPDWVSVSTDGLITYLVPDTAQPQESFPLKIVATNVATGFYREAATEIYVIAGQVIASQVVDSSGASFANGSQEVRVEIPAGTFPQPTTVQIQSGLNKYGNATFSVWSASPPTSPYQLYLPRAEAFSSQSPQSQPAQSGLAQAATFPVQPGCSDNQRPKFRFWLPYLVDNLVFSSCAAFIETADIGEARTRFQMAYWIARSTQTITFKEASWLYSSVPANDKSLTGSEAVLLITGYRISARPIGGGRGYWGHLPDLLSEKGYVPFEFRWNSNARFEDVASDLANAIAKINSLTGRSVHLVAHSFGGIVARTLVQQLGSGGPIDTSLIASITTIGTPHSGLFQAPVPLESTAFPDIDDPTKKYFPNGRDLSLIGKCGQTSCYQMGVGVGISEPDKLLIGLSGRAAGKFIADLSNLKTFPIPSDIETVSLIGITKEGDFLDQGDALISYEGQRFEPSLSVDQGTGLSDRDSLLSQSPQYGGPVTEHTLGFPDLYGPSDFNAPPASNLYPNGYRHGNNPLYLGRGSDAEVSIGCKADSGCQHDTWLQIKDVIGRKPASSSAGPILANASVSVVDTRGTGISGATVYFFAQEYRVVPYGPETTDSSGQLATRLPFAPYAKYRLIVAPPAGSSFESAESVRTVVTLRDPDSSGLTFEPVVLVGPQDSSGDVVGTITDLDLGTQIPNARYSLWSNDTLRFGYPPAYFGGGTTADGSISIQNVNPGQYYLDATQYGYIQGENTNCVVSVAGGNDCSLSLKPIQRPWLQTTGSLTGRVTAITNGRNAVLPIGLAVDDPIDISFGYHPASMYASAPSQYERIYLIYNIVGSNFLSIAGPTVSWGNLYPLFLVLVNGQPDIENDLLNFQGSLTPSVSDSYARFSLTIQDSTIADFLPNVELPLSTSDFDFSGASGGECCIQAKIFGKTAGSEPNPGENDWSVTIDFELSTLTIDTPQN